MQWRHQIGAWMSVWDSRACMFDCHHCLALLRGGATCSGGCFGVLIFAVARGRISPVRGGEWTHRAGQIKSSCPCRVETWNIRSQPFFGYISHRLAEWSSSPSMTCLTCRIKPNSAPAIAYLAVWGQCRGRVFVHRSSGPRSQTKSVKQFLCGPKTSGSQGTREMQRWFSRLSTYTQHGMRRANQRNALFGWVLKVLKVFLENARNRQGLFLTCCCSKAVKG